MGIELIQFHTRDLVQMGPHVSTHSATFLLWLSSFAQHKGEHKVLPGGKDWGARGRGLPLVLINNYFHNNSSHLLKAYKISRAHIHI